MCIRDSIYPALDAGKEVCDDILVVQIQLYEIIIPFPALIPQPVVIIGIPVKTDKMCIRDRDSVSHGFQGIYQ